MHYSNGNYEAFVKADKPKDVDQKSAYIVGKALNDSDNSSHGCISYCCLFNS